MSKGGSSGSGTQQVEQTTTNLPEYARPYFEELLGRTAYESTRPYEAYPGQRIADFTPYEQMGMQGMYDMAAQGAPSQLGMASDIAAQMGYQPSNMGLQLAGGFQPQQVQSYYQPGQFQTGFQAGQISPQYQAGQYYSQIGERQFDPGYTAAPTQAVGDLGSDYMSQYQAQFAMPTYQAGDLQQGYTPDQLNMGYRGTQFTPGYEAGARDSQFQMGDYASGYQAGQFDPGYVARELGQDYTARDLESQYQAGTIAADPETLQAQKQSDIMGSQIEQQAAQAGGLGGYREAIMQSERQRNLGEQLQDIQATGDQAAYQQALQAFEQDRAARAQQEQFRQQAFGTTEEARQAQQRMAIDSFQVGEDARQQAANLGMTAQQQEDAARQAQEQFQQQAFGQTLEARMAEEQLAQGAFQASESARQEAARLGLSAQEQEQRAAEASEQFRQSAFQSNEAARQQQAQLQNQAFQIQEQARQEALRLGLDERQAEELARQRANEFMMQSQQFNVGSAQDQARLMLEGFGMDQATRAQQLDAARLLGQLGGQEQQMAIDRLLNLQASGQIQRELGQRGMDIGYEDFLRQQAFPREQLGLLNQILRGLPSTPGQTTASFGATPSAYQQALGAGIGGVGLYRALGAGG